MNQSNAGKSHSRSLNKSLSRRNFLKLAGAGVGAMLSLSACDVMEQEEQATRRVDLPLSNREQYPHVPGREDVPPPGRLVFFTLDEARTVEALTATILPGSPEDPGARTYYLPPFAMPYKGDSPPEVPDYINNDVLWIPQEMISRFGWQSILTPREFYRIGIQAVNSYARGNHGDVYANLSETQQEEIMTALANDEFEPIGGLPSSEFFNLLRQHTIEGMFGDPAYRGNKDMVGWRLIGYPGAQRAYTPRDMQDESFFTRREPQSLAMLHPFNPGEPGHPNVILPVTGSGTPGPETRESESEAQ
jgi:gluconate 2-dehydrogenase gamma chain